jgi:hypothetical protein
MKILELGELSAETVLIQPIGDHELAGLDLELRSIQELTNQSFRFVAVKVDQWNDDLSPWNAPAVFHDESFGSGAAATLDRIVEYCKDESLTYYIGGYSLAGLFSLWAACQTEVFSGVAAASPSMWFPGFLDYLKGQPIHSRAVYLSLGDKEEKVSNPVLKTVGDCIREGHELFRAQGVDCKLEWNKGNHFREPDMRTAKAFAWLMNTQRGG